MRRTKGTLHDFNNYKVMVNLNLANNYKVMANLDLATLIAIFPSRILELLGHYILDEVA